MIELSWIAEVILNIFYAGRPKSDRKLDIEDFEQLVKFANATIMRNLYSDLKREGIEMAYFGFQLDEPRDFKLSDKDSKGRQTIDLDDSIMRLPRNLGVFGIVPKNDDGENIKIMDAGAQHIYSGEDYEDVPYAIIYAKRIVFYHLPESVKEVEVEGIFDKEDMEVPLDVAVDILNLVLGQSLKVAGFPIDKSDDGNPNVVSVKNKLQKTEAI